MKQTIIIFSIALFTIGIIYTLIKAKKKQVSTKSFSQHKKNDDSPITLEFEKQDLFVSDNLDDQLYNLILKYYPDYDEESFKNLDEVAQTFVLIINLDGQVQNGGLIQFIDNSTGSYFHETIEAVKKIKNKKLVEILTKITIQYPNNQIPKDWDERRELWDLMCDEHENDQDWDKLWDELDDQYYDNAKFMNQNFIDYLKQNAKIKEQ